MKLKIKKIRKKWWIFVLGLVVGIVLLIWFALVTVCPPSCDDGNPCTNDYCDASTGYQCKHDEIKACCGNGICEAGESYENCPADCPCELACGGCENLNVEECVCEPETPCCGDGKCENETMTIYDGDGVSVAVHGVFHTVWNGGTTNVESGMAAYILVDGSGQVIFKGQNYTRQVVFEEHNYTVNNVSFYVNDIYWTWKEGVRKYVILTFGETAHSCPEDCGAGVSIPFETLYIETDWFSRPYSGPSTRIGESSFVYNIITNQSTWREVADGLRYDSSEFSDFKNYFLIMVYIEDSCGPAYPEISSVTQYGNEIRIDFERKGKCKDVGDEGTHIIKIKKSDLVTRENLTFVFRGVYFGGSVPLGMALGIYL